MLDDRALRQRLLGRTPSAGAIDVYNVWTSFQEPEIASNLSLTGRSYQICSDSNRSIFFGSLIFNSANSVEVPVTHNLSNAQKRSTTCTFDVNLPGWWLLMCEGDIRDYVTSTRSRPSAVSLRAVPAAARQLVSSTSSPASAVRARRRPTERFIDFRGGDRHLE